METFRQPGGGRSIAIEVAMVLGLALCLIPFTLTTAFHGDEFTNLYNAVRVARGEVIYRDFFELTAPLTHWLLGWLYLITGPSLLAARLLQAAALVVSGWLLYRLSRALGIGPWSSTLPGVILVAALYRNWPGYSHHWMAWPFVLAAMLATMRALSASGPRPWAIAGLFAGLACLAMQSDGLVLVVAMAAMVALQARPWRVVGRDALALAIGMAMPLGLCAAYFVWQGALGVAWYDVWTWPLMHYKVPGGFNDIPFASDLPASVLPVTQLPAWYGRLFYFLILYALLPLGTTMAIAWGLGLAWRRLSTRAGWTVDEARLAFVGLVTIGFFALLGRGRADVVRVAIYAVPAVLLATALAQHWVEMARSPQLILARWLPHGMLIAFAAMGMVLQLKFMLASPQDWLRHEGPDAALAASPALRYVRDHARPGDRMVAMPTGGYYYFYGLPPASRHPWIWPPEIGFTTEHEFGEAWDEIRRNQPRFLIIAPAGQEASSLQAYLRPPMAAYRRVQTDPSAGHPVYLYERLEGGDAKPQRSGK